MDVWATRLYCGYLFTYSRWIGRAGSTIDNARFIPPNPIILPQALDAWEAYVGDSEEDPVLQIAVIHAQFEILHPFKDGNGRIGRMLIPLVLHQCNLLSRPMFYLSAYLEANLFKAQQIHTLYKQLKEIFLEVTRSQFAVPALDAFFLKPILNSTDFATRSGIGNRVTANALLKTLADRSLIQILRPGAGRTPHIYALGALLNIAEGRDIISVNQQT